MNPDNQLRLSFALCLAVLAILAAGAAAVVVCTPRAGQEPVVPGGSTSLINGPPADDSGKAPPPIPGAGTDARQIAPQVVTSELQPVEPSAESVDSQASADEPEPADVPQPALTGVDEAESPGQPGVTEARSPPAPENGSGEGDEWWIHDLSVETRLFLLDDRDAAGARRVAFPAPIDQRYVVLSAQLTWEGSLSREIRFANTPAGLATVKLADKGRSYHSLGRLVSPADPLAPLLADPLSIDSQSRINLDVAFLLPTDVATVSAVLDGQARGTFTPPAVLVPDVRRLYGVWHRLAGQLHPLRYDDLLIDALADPGCRLLWIHKDEMGYPRLTIPTADVVSDELDADNDQPAMPLTLSWNEHSQPGWLRVTDEGSAIVLYVGDAPGAAFLFKRADR